MTSDEGRRRDARRARDDNRHFRLISVFSFFSPVTQGHVTYVSGLSHASPIL